MHLTAPVVAGRPLRALAAQDEALYCALYASPDVMRHVGAALAPARARAAFACVMDQLGARPPRAAYWLLPRSVQCGPDEALVGLMALQPDASGAQRAEVGVLLPPEAQGAGVATAAIAALADVVFRESGLQVLWTRHADCHVAAAELMRGLGFKPAPRERAGEVRWELDREAW